MLPMDKGLTHKLFHSLSCSLCKCGVMPVQYECENVLNDAALMEACGVGLSRSDMYGVMMVCKQLGEDPKVAVATVRFFGKVCQSSIVS